MPSILKLLARAVSVVVVLPRAMCFWVAAAIVGRDRALESATQSLAGVPGIRGQYMRGAFLRLVGVHCHPSATLCYGTTVSKIGAVFEKNVYVGPSCHLGLVYLEADVLIAAGVHIPSGGRMHGTEDPTVPIREQPGVITQVRIGRGAWIGSGAVILADVGRNTIVGAGSVVTKRLPDHVVAAGVPARTLRTRDGVALPARSGE